MYSVLFTPTFALIYSYTVMCVHIMINRNTHIGVLFIQRTYCY